MGTVEIPLTEIRLFKGLIKNLELAVGFIKKVKMYDCCAVMGIFVKNNEELSKDVISIE